MKLVEKKCPKCGADLSFETKAKEVKCKYCNSSFVIDREGDYSDLVEEMIDPELLNMPVKMFKHFNRVSTIVTIFIFVVAIIIFCVIAFGFFSRI